MRQLPVIEGYEIEALLGEGGMGSVYKGIDRKTGQTVAIKSLHRKLSSPESIARFIQEGEALRQLNHPNIVKSFGTVRGDDEDFLIMEYVGGGDLQILLQQHQQLPLHRILQIALDIADALTRTHRLKIIHRDLKPANVLIAEDGTPRLTDFGIARMGASSMTQEGTMLGTAAYMSPEAITGETVDARSDIWSFGVMLFEMVTGKHPFYKKDDVVGLVVMTILTQAPPDMESLRPDAPIELLDLISRMMMKSPDERISSIRLVGAELEGLLQGVKVDTTQSKLIFLHSLDSEDDARRFASTTPSAGTKIAVKHNLPQQQLAFVGRENELNELKNLLKNNSLLTILASGGMGKTRLAIELGYQSLGDFANGVYLLELAPLTSPDTIPSTIADSLGLLIQNDGREPRQQILDYLRDKEMLLLIDNVEHVLAGATIFSDILKIAPRLKMVATSREKLNLAGEALFNLSGMEIARNLSPEMANESSAVQLFVQAAKRCQWDFELNPDTAPIIMRICRLVEGMPLGILLAAAWLEMLPLHEIADEIARSLDFLESEQRDLPSRQRSIRAVFEYSWVMLNDAERETFAKLSVFRGGFTREAGQVIAGANLRLLSSLVNKSLIRRDGDSGRYQIHEMLRQYAGERLNQMPDKETIHAQASSYYCDWLSKQSDVLWSKNYKEALSIIEEELENLRLAWLWAGQHQQEPLLEQAMTTFLRFYEAKGKYSEFDELFEAACQKLAPDSLIYHRLRVRQYFLAARLGKYEQAKVITEQAMPQLERAGLYTDMLIGNHNLCYVAMMRGDFSEAVELGQHGMKLAEKLADSWSHTSARANLGYTYFLQGKFREAEHLYREIVDILDNDGSPSTLAYLLSNMSEILHAQRKEEEAEALSQKALAIFKAIGNEQGAAFVLNNMGHTAHSLGQFEKARIYLQESNRINRQFGNRHGVADNLRVLGELMTNFLDYPKSLQYYEEALKIYQELGNPRGIADSYVLASTVLNMMGEHQKAEANLQQALTIREKLGELGGVIDVYVHLGDSQLSKFDDKGIRDASMYFAKAQDLMDRNAQTSPSIKVRYLLLIGLRELAAGHYQKSLGIFIDAEKACREINYRWAFAPMFAFQALCYLEVGQAEKALDLLIKTLEAMIEIRSQNWLSISTTVIGRYYELQGNLEKASTLYHYGINLASAWSMMKNFARRHVERLASPPSADLLASYLALSTEEMTKLLLAELEQA